MQLQCAQEMSISVPLLTKAYPKNNYIMGSSVITVIQSSCTQRYLNEIFQKTV